MFLLILLTWLYCGTERLVISWDTKCTKVKNYVQVSWVEMSILELHWVRTLSWNKVSVYFICTISSSDLFVRCIELECQLCDSYHSKAISRVSDTTLPCCVLTIVCKGVGVAECFWIFEIVKKIVLETAFLEGRIGIGDPCMICIVSSLIFFCNVNWVP